MSTTAHRLEVLRSRAAAPGLAPVPWSAVSKRLGRLRGIPPETWATAGLVIDSWGTAAEDEWPSAVTEALERLGWAERWDPRSLGFLVTPVAERSADGFVNGAKGTLFELAVEDAVGAGHIELPDGADELALAADLNQSGWDAELLEDGEVVGVVQMKATDSLAYVERYPDVEHVIVTSEVAEVATTRGVDVIDSGIANADLVEALRTSVDSLDASSLVHEFVPAAALSTVVLRAVRAHRSGASFDEVRAVLAEEGIVLLAAHGAGLIVETTTGAVGLRVITGAAVRLGVQRRRTQRTAGETLARQMAVLTALASRSRSRLVATRPNRRGPRLAAHKGRTGQAEDVRAPAKPFSEAQGEGGVRHARR